MELRQLKYFLAVAEELNFTRAAQRLHMAQPPLSQQVKALEDELGFALFRRTTRKVELTPAGRHFAGRVRDLGKELRNAVSEAASVANGARGVVRIGFVGTATYHLMPQVLACAQREFPEVKVEVEGELLTPQIEDRLKRRVLDLAVIRPPVSTGRISVELLREDPFEVAFAENDPLAGSTEPLDIADLRERSFVSYPADAAAAIAFYSACREAGFLPGVAHETDRMSTLLTLVGVGSGIAVVPAGSVPPAQFPVCFRSLTGIAPIGLAISGLKEAQNPLITRISGLLRRELAGGEGN